MTKARITSLDEELVPSCPHCGSAEIAEACLSVIDLVDAWKHLGEFVPVDSDGYAWITGHLIIDCPECRHPSVLRSTGPSLRLIAARTDADRRILPGAAA